MREEKAIEYTLALFKFITLVIKPYFPTILIILYKFIKLERETPLN